VESVGNPPDFRASPWYPSLEIARTEAKGPGTKVTGTQTFRARAEKEAAPTNASHLVVPGPPFSPRWEPTHRYFALGAGLLGPSGRPIKISFSWPTVMVPAHWDQLNTTIVTRPKQENSSEPLFEEYQSLEAPADPKVAR